MDRPLHRETPRRRRRRTRVLTALVTAAIGLGAGGCDSTHSSRPPKPPPAGELGRPIGPSTHSAAPPAARDAARRFLHGSLAAVYGRGQIDAIPASTQRLRDLLHRQSG